MIAKIGENKICIFHHTVIKGSSSCAMFTADFFTLLSSCPNSTVEINSKNYLNQEIDNVPVSGIVNLRNFVQSDHFGVCCANTDIHSFPQFLAN